MEDLGSIPGWRRSPGERKGYPLQYAGLENSMDSPWAHKESDMTELLSLIHSLLLRRKAVVNLDSMLKSRDITLLTKVHNVKAMVFPLVMYRCENWTSWALTNWCFWTVVLEKTLEAHLDSKYIEPVHPKGNQLWIFTERSVAEALIVWPPNTKNWLTGKAPHARKDRRQKKGGGSGWDG